MVTTDTKMTRMDGLANVQKLTVLLVVRLVLWSKPQWLARPPAAGLGARRPARPSPPAMHMAWTGRLGDYYAFLTNGFKPYCCAIDIHSPINALTRVITAHDLRAHDIAEIVVPDARVVKLHSGVIVEPHDITGPSSACIIRWG